MHRLLLPTFALALAAASPAAAQLTGDCETSPDGCGNPAPPTKPSLPGAEGVGGFYRAYIDNSYDAIIGFVTGDKTARFGGGQPHPIGGDGTVRDGFAASSVTLRATDVNSTGGATAATTTSADASYAAEASTAVSYLVELHAANAAAFAALQPFLHTSGAIATIGGGYTLAATGQAFSAATANTGVGIPLDGGLQQSFGAMCDFSGYHDSTGAECGTGLHYALDLNFATGSSFTNGNRLSLYGTVEIGTDTHAGRTGVDGDAGRSSAFIDPTITLNPLFNSPLYTLNVGNAVTPATPGVPEPGVWALLLAGFGAVGGAARRKRLPTVAA